MKAQIIRIESKKLSQETVAKIESMGYSIVWVNFKSSYIQLMVIK